MKKKEYVAMGLRGRLSKFLWSRLYRDTNHDPSRAVMVVGTARSGSTWVAEIVRRILPYRIVFEPFYPPVLSRFAERPLFPYVPEGADDPELAAFVRSMLSGPPRDRWLDGHIDILRPRGRIVKLVRGCLVAGWLRATFPAVPLLLVLRHPCAVAHSRLRLGWDPRHDLDALLSDPSLEAGLLAPYGTLLRELRSPAAENAAIWAIHTKGMLDRWPVGGRAPAICYYEDLCSASERACSTLAAELGGGPVEARHLGRGRPSRTARRDAAVYRGSDAIRSWCRDLDTEAVRDVLDVVGAFGLGHLYDADPEPVATRRT